MKVFIIEDEELSVERLERQLKEMDPLIDIAGVGDSVMSSVNWLKNNDTPDLILMDIELGDGQCFNIFRQVPIKSAVLFITSFDESTMKAFKENSIDYLLKPIKKTDLHKCLENFKSRRMENADSSTLDIEHLISELKKQQQHTSYRHRLLVRHGHGLMAIEMEDIAYFYTEGRHFYLRTWEKETYAINHTLSEIEQMLDLRNFRRISPSFIVHTRSIGQIHNQNNNEFKIELQPATDKELIMDKQKMDEMILWKKSYRTL